MSVTVTAPDGTGPSDHLSRGIDEQGPWCFGSGAFGGVLVAALLWYVLPLAVWIGAAISASSLIVWIIGVVASVVTAAGVTIGFLVFARKAPEHPFAATLISANTNAGLILAWAAVLLSALIVTSASFRAILAIPLGILGIAACVIAVKGKFSRPIQDLTDDAPVVGPPDGEDDYTRRMLTWTLEGALGPEAKGAVEVYVHTLNAAKKREANPTRMDAKDGTPRFSFFVNKGRCREVDELAERFKKISVDLRLDKYLEIEMVLSGVQSIEYVTDIQSKGQEDYWRFPIETLDDGVGDCEDTAILLAAILSAMGHRVCFLTAPGHAALGIADVEGMGTAAITKNGIDFLYAETTGEGFRLGELPEGIRPSDLEAHEIIEPAQGHQQAVVVRHADPRRWAKDNLVLTTTAVVLIAAVALLPTAGWWHT